MDIYTKLLSPLNFSLQGGEDGFTREGNGVSPRGVMVNPSSPIRPERDARSARLASRVPSTRIASSLLVCPLALTFATVCCRTFAFAARVFCFV